MDNDDYIVTKTSDKFYIFDISPMSPATPPQLRDDLNKMLSATRQKRQVQDLPEAAETNVVQDLPVDPNYTEPVDPPPVETAVVAGGNDAVPARAPGVLEVEKAVNFEKKEEVAKAETTLPSKPQTTEKITATVEAKKEEGKKPAVKNDETTPPAKVEDSSKTPSSNDGKKTAAPKNEESKKEDGKKPAVKNDEATPPAKEEDSSKTPPSKKDNGKKTATPKNEESKKEDKKVEFEDTVAKTDAKDAKIEAEKTTTHTKKVPPSEAFSNLPSKSVQDIITANGTVTAGNGLPPFEPGLPPLSKEGEAFMKMVKPIIGIQPSPPPPHPSFEDEGKAMDENTKGLGFNTQLPIKPIVVVPTPIPLAHPPLADIVTPKMYSQIPTLAAKEVVRNPEISQVYFNWIKERERFQLQCYDANVQEVILSSQLAYVLGFKENSVLRPGSIAKYPPDLKGGVSQFGIYTKELSENVIVGNQFTTLLRIVTIRSKPGEINEQLYDSPMYVRVASRDISSINIEIRGMDGRLIPFSYGPVIVTLHFKKLLY
uniref:Uncharacterized protein n=1 Tax=Panagrolaimus davidi TaxID=227884 RepID=A0A914QIU8_9BILA